MENIFEIIAIVAFMLIVLVLFFGKRNRKIVSIKYPNEDLNEKCNLNRIPIIYDGDRTNLIRICTVIEKDGNVRTKHAIPSHISPIIHQNSQFYTNMNDRHKIFPNDGSVTYEYLIIHVQNDNTEKEYSGVTTDYEEITKKIEELSPIKEAQ